MKSIDLVLRRCFFSARTLIQENVLSLNHSHFLRLHGATSIGIRTSFGVPVVSRWGVTFVIVFYSRAAVQVRVSHHVYLFVYGNMKIDLCHFMYVCVWYCTEK